MRDPDIQDTRRRDKKRRGSATVEFVLAGTFIFVPMLAGLATVGMSMVQANQVASLNTTAGQMFSSGADFSPQGNSVGILQKMAGTLYTSSSAGGVVILTEIDGTNGGPVCSTSITIQLGTGGTGGASQCSAFIALMSGMVSGQIAYLAETYYNNPQLAWAFAPANTGSGIYVKAVF